MNTTMVEKIVGLPEDAENVRTARLRDGDSYRIMTVFAANKAIVAAKEDEQFESRVRLIKNGWRDLCLIRSRLQRLIEYLPCTVPPEKRIGFVRTATRMKYQLLQGPLASKPKPNEEEIVTTRELEALVEAAWDGRCRICLEDRCETCELGRALDNIVAKDRDGGSWSSIDIRKAG